MVIWGIANKLYLLLPTWLLETEISADFKYSRLSQTRGSGAADGMALHAHDGIIVCQKVIPKGFSITPGNDTITIYTPAAALVSTTCYISAQAADIASTTILTNLSSHVAGVPATALSTNATTILNGTGGTVLGDGLNILTIYWEAGSGLTTSNSPSAIVITMSRV